MIKACIFDLDGTLAYTLDSMAVVGNEVVRKYGLKPMPKITDIIAETVLTCW